jgi:CHAD domain-containing protein
MATGASLPVDLLHRPTGEAARLIALVHLDAAAAAQERLADPEDGEALHDLRVALRRLRSTLRAYRPWLGGTAAKKLRRRARDLGRSTSAARDADVQLAWLRAQGAALAPREHAGLRWLEERVAARRDATYDRLARRLPRALAKLEQRLRRRLAVYRVKVRVGDDAAVPLFGAVTAGALRTLAGELLDALEGVADAADAAGQHAARIATKRVRYLLEPLTTRVPGGRALVRQLQQLQDVLGELHDAHVLAGELAAAVAEAAAARARYLYERAVNGQAPGRRRPPELRLSPRAGLLALARRLRAERDALFERYTVAWLPRMSDLAAQLERAAVGLERALPRGPTGGAARSGAGRRARRRSGRRWSRRHPSPTRPPVAPPAATSPSPLP